MRALASAFASLAAVSFCHAALAEAPPPWKVTATYPNGSLARAALLSNVKMGPVTCARGMDFGRHENGKLSFCNVANPTDVGGIPIAKDAYTLFHPDERVWQTTMSKPMVLPTGDGTKVSCEAALVSLTPAGALESCTLRAVYKGKLASCLAGKSISFHPSGALFACAVDAPFAGLGTTFPKGTWIRWSEDGSFAGGDAPSMKIGALSIEGAFKVHKNGKLAEAVLDDKATVATHEFPRGATLSFRDDGSLEKAVYIEKSGFMIHGEPWTDTRETYYDASGKVLTTHVTHWQSHVRPPKFR